MALDFSRLNAPSTADSVLNPRDIFRALPAKQPKFQSYLRDVQSEVLDQWFTRRQSRDLRLKMNTGGGKTVVGLLILKSCLNEDCGPAAYIAPTPYLASQVMQEATALGLAVSDDPRSLAVARGRAILVTTINTLFNGRSKFGVGDNVDISIGTFVLDDAHACLAICEQQFTLKLPSSHVAYKKLFAILRPDLEAQSSNLTLDVQEGEPNSHMLVPYWAWVNRLPNVEAILHELRTDDDLKFVWPLLRHHLRHCRCVFGGGSVEISPRCLPSAMIPTFTAARRRVFMSATFADDSVLITDFNALPTDIETAIAPESASDIGDRMILVPQELDPNIPDEQIKNLAVHFARKWNVVVIVPSEYRYKFWEDAAKLKMTADSLEEGVGKLNSGHVGLVVIINKYDGIDLPHNACRVLILDGLPDVRRAVDRLDQSCLQGTDMIVGKSIQQIEQGMGRGVRATDDFCAVILMGRSLIGQIFSGKGVARLTPATRVQFDLSEQIGNQVRGKGIVEIAKAFEHCLARDPDWVKAAKAALVHVKYTIASSDLTTAIARRAAFDSAIAGDYPSATATLQTLINGISDPKTKGWLLAELAEYTHAVNQVESQQILRSAVALNRQLPVKPLVGTSYIRIDQSRTDQATACIEFMKASFNRPNDVIVAANAISEELAFRPDSYRRFERAMCDAARFLGFNGQMPEAECGKGPDVLWSVGSLRYFVIECKSEATNQTISKDYCNQLAGSANWFSATYDSTCKAAPILVHPSAQFETAATPPPGAMVMTASSLQSLRTAIVEFCVAISSLAGFGRPKEVATLLTHHNLVPEKFLKTFTVHPRN